MTGDKRWFSSLVLVVTERYITFGDNEIKCHTLKFPISGCE
jgi:hypothetical protein